MKKQKHEQRPKGEKAEKEEEPDWEAMMAVTEGLRFETRSVRRACGCRALVCGDCALC